MSQPLAQASQTSPQAPARPVLKSPYPTEPKPYKPGLAERLYLPLFSGMMVTMRHFLKNLFGKKMYTIQYNHRTALVYANDTTATTATHHWEDSGN